MTLENVIEMHVHAAPDIRKRAVDDWGIVKSANEAKMRAVVIKSHFFPTMCRAEDMQRVSEKTRIFGGIAMNYCCGGLNPYAAERAVDLGAKIIWLPTHDAENHYKKMGKTGGISVINGQSPREELKEIVKTAADRQVILGTGHLSPYEICHVAELAVKYGVNKLVINHPELHIVGLSIEEQKELAKAGVYFERVYAQPITPGNYHVNLEDNYEAIEELGYENTIVSTDGGQVENPFWTTALLEYLDFLEKKGLKQEAIDRMTKGNPAKLLEIENDL